MSKPRAKRASRPYAPSAAPESLLQMMAAAESAGELEKAWELEDQFFRTLTELREHTRGARRSEAADITARMMHELYEKHGVLLKMAAWAVLPHSAGTKEINKLLRDYSAAKRRAFGGVCGAPERLMSLALARLGNTGGTRS